MKTKSIQWWNALAKDKETDVTACEGDSVILIDGIAFLLQRKNEWNNVVCWKVKTTRKDLVSIFCKFRSWCERQKIQYIRVEGHGKHQYKMLYLVLRQAPKEANLVYAKEESEKSKAHIWYIKNY